ncbi:MAG: DUF4412 domain-containing protein [Akkermansiaceae bacterium]|nr:DUF4412 domain-containing protein [Akkermansiaceae bacterium]
MKTKVLIFSAACSTLSFADLILKQSIEGPTKGEMTMTVKGDRMKIDMAGQATTIIDNKTKDTVTLMHPQKMLMKMSGAEMKGMMDQAKAAAGAATLKSTGEKEKVGEYDCEIYDFSSAGTTTKMWIAKDYPGFAEIKAEMEKLMAQGDDTKVIDFPGMVVKNMIDIGGQKMTTTLISAKSESVDESAFAIPEGYKEMQMPGTGK